MKNVTKLKFIGIISAIALIAALAGVKGLVGYNVEQEWQVVQQWGGDLRVIETGGPYLKWFAPTWTYPRTTTSYFSADVKEGGEEDDSIRITFNDGGTADISVAVRWTTAVGTKQRQNFHVDMSSDIAFAESALRSYLINVLKNTAPMMSASEHQSARKSEFDRLVNDQLVFGTYETRKVERTLKDQYDEDGNPITVFATEVVLDESGKPKIAKTNPLAQYGIIIQQFNITSTDYDPRTRQQFEAKKESYLRAEQSKAEREEMVQERLMIVERGLRDRADIEAEALKEKARAVIAAEREKEVAETQAQQQLEVERLEKERAETAAARQLEVARLERQSAEENAAARMLLADAKKYELEQAGGLSEELAAILDANIRIAEVTSSNLSRIAVPSQVFLMGGGSGEGGDGTDLSETMFSLRMWQDITGAYSQPMPQPRLNTVTAGGANN